MIFKTVVVSPNYYRGLNGSLFRVSRASALLGALASFACSSGAKVAASETAATTQQALGAPGQQLAIATISANPTLGSDVSVYGLQTPVATGHPDGHPLGLALGDTLGDKTDEVAFASSNGGVQMFAVGFGKIFPYPTLGAATFKDGDVLAMGNVDGDAAGTDELIIADRDVSSTTPGDGIRIFSRTGTEYSFFPEFPSTPKFQLDGAMVACDLNGDGSDEIIVADPAWRIYTKPGVTDPTIQVSNYFGGTPPSFQPTFSTLACGDVNGDHVDDLIIGDGKSGCVQIVTNPSKPAISFVPDPSSLLPGESCVRSERGDVMAAGDLNADGFDEITIGRPGSGVPGSVRIFAAAGHPVTSFFSGSPSFSNGDKLAIGRHTTGLVDTDDDGLPDLWETQPIDMNQDGCPDLDLTVLGVDPFRKDIFIEMDAMACSVAGGDCAADPNDLVDPSGTHSHLPSLSDFDPVVTAFDNAPLPPPAGAPPGTKGGIKLHFELGPSQPDLVPHKANCELGKVWCQPSDFCSFDPLIPCNPKSSCFNEYKLQFFGTAAERAGVGPACPAGMVIPPAVRAQQILGAKSRVFHYGLWGHNLSAGDSTLGQGEGATHVDCPIIGHSDVNEETGNDAMFWLYGASGQPNGTPWDRATTFMHELGHNLSLAHGGGDAINNKPNYLSLMNYSFNTGLPHQAGLPPTLDFSRAELPPLLETGGLDETKGIQGPSGFVTSYICPNGSFRLTDADKPIDWDCNNLPNTSSQLVTDDVNNDRLCISQVGALLDSTNDGDDLISQANSTILPGPDGCSQSGIKHAPDPGDVVTATSVAAGSDFVLQTVPICGDTIVNRIDPGIAAEVLAVPAASDDVIGFMQPGPDGTYQTPIDSRDVLSGNSIIAGTDGILHTVPLAGSNDQRTVLRVLPGADQKLDTVPDARDNPQPQLIIAAAGRALYSARTYAGKQQDDSFDGQVVGAGPDGILQTPKVEDDLLQGREIVDGGDRYCGSNRSGDDANNEGRWLGTKARETYKGNNSDDKQPATLYGYNDWAHVKLAFQESANFAFDVHYSVIQREELTTTELTKQHFANTRADVAITATAPSSITPGKPFTYQVTISNAGTDTALGIKAGLQLAAPASFSSCSAPSGVTCSNLGGVQNIVLDSLLAGQSVTVDIVATVGGCSSSNVVLTGTLVTSSTDPKPSDNTLNVSTPVTAVPPVFTLALPELTISTCTGVTLPTPVATSSCGPVTFTNDKPAKFPLGRTIVTWTATSALGGSATATQVVTAILADDSSCCPTGSHIIIGTSNNDTLNGTAGPDCILGRGSQDTINGNGGDDVLSGGDGNDTINGGDGNDKLYGGTGQDNLNGQNGNDVLYGNDGDDICHGNVGADALYGGQGQDQLFGDDGDDQLYGEYGDDTLTGGAGNDYLEGNSGTNDRCLDSGSNLYSTCETAGLANACLDGVKDGGETATDCGGTGCAGCAAGVACNAGSDCLGGVCSGGICLAPLSPLQAKLAITSDWGTGYCVGIEVTNVGTTPFSTWKISFATNQSTITSTSNGSFDAATGSVHAVPQAGYTTIAPGATRTGVGFCANRTIAGVTPKLLGVSGS